MAILRKERDVRTIVRALKKRATCSPIVETNVARERYLKALEPSRGIDGEAWYIKWELAYLYAKALNLPKV